MQTIRCQKPKNIETIRVNKYKKLILSNVFIEPLADIIQKYAEHPTNEYTKIPIPHNLKLIIGHVFTTFITDIIYEYAKCCYCFYVKSCVLSYLDTHKCIIEDNNDYGMSIEPDVMYMFVCDGQWQVNTKVSTSIDQVVYSLVHLGHSIFDLDNETICMTNVNHTDTINPMENYFCIKLLQSIGANIVKHYKTKTLMYDYDGDIIYSKKEHKFYVIELPKK